MSKQCEVCGRRLTAFNRAWGTNKCSPCAKGRSAAAKKRSVTVALEQAAYRSEEEIGTGGRFGVLAGALVLLLFINVGAFACRLAGVESGNNLFVLGEIAVFYFGIKVVGGAVFGRAALLTIRRWKSCWHGDVLGYIIGYFIFPAFLLPIAQSIRDAANGPDSRPRLILIVAFALAPAMGLLIALVNGTWADRRNIRKTQESFREWRDSQLSQGNSA